MDATTGAVIGAVTLIAAYAGLHVLNRGTDTSQTPSSGTPPSERPGMPMAPKPPAPKTIKHFYPNVYLAWSYGNDAGDPAPSIVFGQAWQALKDWAAQSGNEGSLGLVAAIRSGAFNLLQYGDEIVANVRAYDTTYYFFVGTFR